MAVSISYPVGTFYLLFFYQVTKNLLDRAVIMASYWPITTAFSLVDFFSMVTQKLPGRTVV